MIIDLKTITHEPRHFQFTLTPDWWKRESEEDQILGFDVPLDVRMTVYKAGEKFVLEGSLTGRFRMRCDRCLDAYLRDFSSDFRTFLSLPPSETEDEVELLAEDLLVDFVVGDEVDLGEIVKEQIILALPMKSLCREDCPGLCPICGANLNIKPCGCKRNTGHPAFSKLKNLRIKGERI